MTSPLEVMRTLVGTQWSSGAPSPTILAWEEFIATAYPDMAAYIRAEERTYLAWCGLTVAYCMAKAGIRPVNEFLWALNWRSFGSDALGDPQPGDVAVFAWSGGGHHVTLIDHGQTYLGGNQSHEVRDSTFSARPIAVRRPPTAGTQPQPSEDPNPFLENGATGPAVTRLQQLLGIAQDGEFGDNTKAAVIAFQTAHPPLDVDGQVGPLTWAALNAGTPVQPQPSQPPPLGAWASGKGSWYSQFSGKYTWHDTGDKPGSNALGVPDECQGISFYDHSTLGHWFELRAPNGVVSIEQQTEIGPAPWTGRKIDISAACAERIGYSPHNFPTDAPFSWVRIDPPSSVAGLSPQQQAVKFNAYRKEQPMPTDTAPAPVNPVPVNPAPVPLPVPLPIGGFDPAAFFDYITHSPTQAKTVLDFAVGLFNATHQGSKITLPAAPPPPIPAPAGSTMGLEHLGVLGMLGTLATQLIGGLGPFLGAGASPTSQALGILFGGLAGAGTLSKIGPTLKSILLGIAAVLAPK